MAEFLGVLCMPEVMPPSDTALEFHRVGNLLQLRFATRACKLLPKFLRHSRVNFGLHARTLFLRAVLVEQPRVQKHSPRS